MVGLVGPGEGSTGVAEGEAFAESGARVFGHPPVLEAEGVGPEGGFDDASLGFADLEREGSELEVRLRRDWDWDWNWDGIGIEMN